MSKQIQPHQWLRLYYGILKKTVLVRKLSTKEKRWELKLYHTKSGLSFFIKLELLTQNRCLATFYNYNKQVSYQAHFPQNIWDDLYRSLLIKTLLRGLH